MKPKRKVVILTESQVKSLMDNLKVERDKENSLGDQESNS